MHRKNTNKNGHKTQEEGRKKENREKGKRKRKKGTTAPFAGDNNTVLVCFTRNTQNAIRHANKVKSV